MLCYDCPWTFWESSYPSVYHAYVLFDSNFHLESVVIRSTVAMLPAVAMPLVRSVAANFGFDLMEPPIDPSLWKYSGSAITCRVKEIAMPKDELTNQYELREGKRVLYKGNFVNTFYEMQMLRNRGHEAALSVFDRFDNLVCNALQSGVVVDAS